MAEIIDKKANFYFHKFPSAGKHKLLIFRCVGGGVVQKNFESFINIRLFLGTYYGDENPNEGI